MTLAEFLKAGAATPFAWGHNDCCLWVVSWVQMRRGVDPAAHLRGYTTERGALRHIRRAGDLPTLVALCMDGAGLERTDAPGPGDIGVVQTDQGPALALRTERGWAAKAPAGVVVGPFLLIQAWAV